MDTKPNISLTTISSLEDCELLLTDEDLFNYFSSPGLGTLSSDEFFVTTDVWTSESDQTARNGFVFADKVYPVGEQVTDWSSPYQQVYVSNIVLEALNKFEIRTDQKEKYNFIKGTALFYRAWAFMNLLETFSLPYNASNSDVLPGIILRLSSDFNIKLKRANQTDCYKQIIQDLETSVSLLPTNTQYVTKPTKAAANGLLSRIYLIMGNYNNALKYADETLKLKPELLDFNLLGASPYTLTADQNLYPINEILFHNTLLGYSLFASFTRMIADSTLYSMYEENDIRKSAFFTSFRDNLRFKGSYEFKRFGAYFSGLATDEIYLTRAECYARLGNTNSAMNDLNTLLQHRYITGTFINRTAANPDDALDQVLKERRKELCFRGIRWMDLRRLNNEQKYATNITHVINGTSYVLPPNDPKYAFPIPDAEIELSGIEQNQR